jgi:hypothetical protein
MMAGPNSPDLRILAGLRRPYFRPDVESRLERAVSELRI